MAFKVLIADDRLWRKDCSRIPRDILQKILVKIRDLEQDPWPANIQVKCLKEYSIADFRLKVGEYRVLFKMNEEQKIVYLARVRHRSKLY
jgi:mRNA interferase RelE/StbE